MKKLVNFRIEESIYKELKKKCIDENVNMTSLILKLIFEYLNKKQ